VVLEPLNVLAFMLVAWLVIYLLSQVLPFEKFGVEVAPLYLTYRTGRLNAFLKNTAAKRPRLWKVMANVGVALAVGEILLSVYLLGSNLLHFLYAPEQAQAVFPLLPGITIGLQWFPYLLIAIGLAITVHELAHGIVASLEGVAITSAGIIIAPITFGGFVEPDEEDFEKAGLVEKLRFLAAGSLSNLIVGLLVTLIATSLFVPGVGVLVRAVEENGPAYVAGVRPWDVIYGINETRIEDLVDLAAAMDGVKPNDLLVVDTTSGIRSVRAGASATNASRGVMGVYNLVDYVAVRGGWLSPQATYHLNLTTYWLHLLMINLAVFNMLPLYPLDGEAFVHALLKRRVKKNLKAVRVIVSSVAFALLALNMVLSFLRYGLTPI
jgi:membrane-associated protease RseP (regulator of RpoE activity)